MPNTQVAAWMIASGVSAAAMPASLAISPAIAAPMA